MGDIIKLINYEQRRVRCVPAYTPSKFHFRLYTLYELRKEESRIKQFLKIHFHLYLVLVDLLPRCWKK